MSYPADPGGNFASDAHRRVMAALANPDEPHLTLDELQARVDEDDFLDLDRDEVTEVLSDLEADGDATRSEKGWKNTKSGFEVLTGNNADNGGRVYGE